MTRIRVYKPSELVLMKAKYTKRWKGPDGKWRYEYGKPQPLGKLSGTSGEKMRQAANIMEGENLPLVSSYSEVPVPDKVNAKERKILGQEIRDAVPGNYHTDIPVQDIKDAAKKAGFVLLMEDGTEWSGMLLGDNSDTFFKMGRLRDGRMLNGLATYKPVANSGVVLTWYKMHSGKYEIVKYVA